MGIVSAMKTYQDLFTDDGVQQEIIYEAAQRLGLAFSKEYVEYLSEFGIAAVNGHELTGLGCPSRTNVIDVTMEERQYNSVPTDWYVVEQANIDGIVIWQSGDGIIYQTMPNQKPIKLCESLAEYISM